MDVEHARAALQRLVLARPALVVLSRVVGTVLQGCALAGRAIQRNEQPGKWLVHLVGASGEALSYPADGDAWVTVDDPELLPWLAKVQVASVDGVPRIIGLQLLPRHEAPLPGGLQVRDFTVTAEALRRLPLRELRELALRMQRMGFGVPVRNVSPGVK